ncbi:helix-turn-helix transcriptional regulator [Rhizobium rhizogenes]|uniref:helix-turn-helix transcriptional regulator n=1 Tax=Rhizobium rhizogenes TaxID=359 RepID=UPI0024BEA9F8|nr:AlpA family phage regulatory protein [Rhizobium rhizogenes]MDJ1633209.1 AlpA family phage regulatory protein [Rhizobium rhizogenes]
MRVISIDDLKSKGIVFSKTHIYRLMKAGKFPRPAKLSPRQNVWSEEEIDSWIAGRFAERDGVAA